MVYGVLFEPEEVRIIIKDHLKMGTIMGKEVLEIVVRATG
jgi:hypothetical protein